MREVNYFAHLIFHNHVPPQNHFPSVDQAMLVSSVLNEAADWLASQGKTLWLPEHLSSESINSDVKARMYYIAWVDQSVAGVVRLQLEDPLFWPEVAEGEAVYLHRLAISRQFAGGGISNSILRFAMDRAAELKRKYVRLDCVADRPSLRNIYERFGFKFHSLKQVGPYLVSRYQIEASSC